MSDERRFIHVCAGCGAQMTHVQPCAPGCGSIEAESIEVVEAAALARVKRERDVAREAVNDLVQDVMDTEAERDALRAQVEALTGVLAVAISAEAERQWAANEVPVEEYVGWKDAAEWLAAARDAAAAKAPDDPLR